MISVIVSIARNRAIGFENRLLYRLPDDLRRFKALTTGHTIIMGRKTFESFPKGALPNRRNIVLSKNKAALPLAQKLYLTEIEDTPQQADAFFPPFDIRLWELIQSSRHDRDEKHQCPFSFKDYQRKSHH